ncbi:MAG: AbrB/MazE/SpoVT family DNA-binding domain-containing protein [Actinomycetota bacterium]|nr:AbrB/MazE/SpoVT family DNA-binding domain-containing protein [Actinomycetota bacterium]
MTNHRVGPKGQVVIPKALRDELELEPGDEVVFTLGRDGVLVAPARSAQSLRGVLDGRDLVGALQADRRSEPR